MHIEEYCWHSPHLQREMALKVYGHWGAPYIVFPCSRGRYFDYEGMGMIAALAGFIDSGRVKLFAVDSVDAESWYDFGAPPAARNARHEAYDRYITAEVVPFMRQHCASPEARVMANGCRMGAHHAVNFFLRHPDLFAGTIALTGLLLLFYYQATPEGAYRSILFLESSVAGGSYIRALHRMLSHVKLGLRDRGQGRVAGGVDPRVPDIVLRDAEDQRVPPVEDEAVQVAVPEEEGPLVDVVETVEGDRRGVEGLREGRLSPSRRP